MRDFKTLPELFQFITENHDQPRLLSYRSDNAWKYLTTKDFAESVVGLAKGLIQSGLTKGEKVGIISNPSPFWVIADMAIVIAGGITVPIFRRISPENLSFEIEDSQLSTIFIGDRDEYEPVKLYGSRVSKIITMGFQMDDPKSISFNELIALGENVDNRANQPPLLTHKGFHQPSENDLFTVIYTSGSLGRPKGVMLTHQNIISQVKAAGLLFDIDKARDRALTSLPLSHIFERMVMYYYLSKGVSVYFVDDLNNIAELAQDVHPTMMTVVPRLLEKVYAAMRKKTEDLTGLQKLIAQAAFDRADKKDVNQRPSGIIDFLYQKLVYSKYLQALGGKLRYVISGAAPLPEYIGRFFLNIGLPVYEGYGLTEASPVLTVNSPGKRKLGTVGLPFPSVTIKIGPDGEILAKGPNIMKGYLNNTEETSGTLDSEGILHTGDKGFIDDEGFLKITGRIKELFKKSTGEYVPPVPIEQALSRLEIVDMAVVIAESRKFVSCLLFPNFDAVQRLKEKNGFASMSMEEFLECPFIRKMVQDYILGMNNHLHHTEAVQKFTLIKTPISIETGELTPTLKIRRSIIEQKFRNEIDAMYQEP